jgi:hypothetical protein
LRQAQLIAPSAGLRRYIQAMLDPITSAAFAIHNSKGVYALLLGSGISRAAQVPTGWEVTLDLIRRLAALESETESCDPNPEAWYNRKFGISPNYSNLLEQLAISPAERTAALARYFEGGGTDEDPTHQPTRAHAAIARLVKRGYIRVIITTNFDRLMERALEAEGVSPAVLSTPDSIEGALPLAHATCTLIKIHGDYRDARLRNTEAELSTYDAQTRVLIDRVLDDYGLIVSGWSATWDVALRNAIERAPNRRFTTVWTYVGRLTREADDLILLRSAQRAEVKSADDFFSQLNEKIEALERFDAPHPLSIEIAVRSVKKYVVEDRFRVQLHDLVMQEVTTILAETKDLSLNEDCTDELYAKRIERYESNMKQLLPVLMNAAYWCQPLSTPLLQSVLERLMRLKEQFGGKNYWVDLQLYPACLAFYSIGLGLVAAGNYTVFASVVRYRTGAAELNHRVGLALGRLSPRACLYGDALNRVLSQKWHTPANERILSVFQPLIDTYLLSVPSAEDLLDRFEYLCALVLADDRMTRGERPCGWGGRWQWRHREFGHIHDKLNEERQREADCWPIVASGLFSSLSRFDEVMELHRAQCLLPVQFL